MDYHKLGKCAGDLLSNLRYGLATGMGSGLAHGMFAGAGAGSERGDIPAGIGRGAVRGIATGGGIGAGAALGGGLTRMGASGIQDTKTKLTLELLGMLAGGALGGAAGWKGSGKLLGEPSYWEQTKESADLSSMIGGMAAKAKVPNMGGMNGMPLSSGIGGMAARAQVPNLSGLNKIPLAKTPGSTPSLYKEDMGGGSAMLPYKGGMGGGETLPYRGGMGSKIPDNSAILSKNIGGQLSQPSSLPDAMKLYTMHGAPKQPPMTDGPSTRPQHMYPAADRSALSPTPPQLPGIHTPSMPAAPSLGQPSASVPLHMQRPTNPLGDSGIKNMPSQSPAFNSNNRFQMRGNSELGNVATTQRVNANYMNRGGKPHGPRAATLLE